ncbi:uncharacterized protein KLTH0G15180g [Lachancea thermotolerans CBS 6340]|uniref:KLTH0G15180p n=1 Tax=Lachancea thermotolerans (strain ATCC 56472 / CBS 6340 / NRRL Y-8284) TaxID=559295 RepID=C5DN95_LACTC|nr:KLTH0G15180p [Lachancea thermotolerans CBS 6340]CAR25256.1 KLTH0G15180p [Lachancea thermotolerans CBS 6340]
MGRPPKIVSQENIERFQLELELAGQDAELLLKDKKGRSRSCLLCQRRKRRCDHKMPSCTACLKAAVKCIQPAKYVGRSPRSNTPSQSPQPQERARSQTYPNNEKNEYTAFLEKKLKYLEKLFELPPNGTPFKNRLSNYKRIAHLLDGQSNNALELPAPTYSNSVPLPSSTSSPILPPPQTVKFFPLQPDNLSAGKSPLSAHPIASLAALTSDSLESIDFSQCIFAKYCLKDFLSYDPAFEFEEQLSRAFLDTYFTRLQFKYPLLDEQEIYNFHDDYINNNVHSYSTNEFHFACGRMWLIFSISACLQMSTGKYRGLLPNRYFSTAIRHITKCGSNLTYIQQVEVLSLLLLYIIRTDRDSSGLYEIIKDVMAICKNKLFLNRWNQHDIFRNKKLRLFWCVYSLERMICVAVGKPYTISEAEIDLPLFDNVSFNHNSTGDHKRQKKDIHFINQSLKLRRIESQFVESLQIIPQTPSKAKDTHKTTAELAKQLPQVRKYFRDLEVWRAGCSTCQVHSFENETLRLYYFRSVRLLIQPYLELLEPENRLFRECQAAAGQICQLYKIVHQKTVHGHSTPAVHTVFVAGVTLIYCMWLTRNLEDERRRKLGDVSKHTRPMVSASLFSTMDDLRACSVCLYVMAERSKFAIAFRDTFDQLMNATIGNLIERCGPDSSELIYVNSFSSDSDLNYDISEEEQNEAAGGGIALGSQEGMPPAIRRTFGTASGTQHVSIGGSSQVDPEEQRALRKKQGDLQKATVPKKLSHLLIKPDDEDEDDDINYGGHEMKRKASSHGRHQSEKEKYVVKKSARITESDWQAFQQQALLQQHHAQQTLQAYLSSLNSKVGDRNQEVMNAGKPLVGPGGPRIGKELIAPLNGPHEKPQPVKIDFHAANSQTWLNQNGNVQEEGARAEGSSRNLHPGAAATAGALKPIGVFSPSDMDYSGILFNNGAHTMINNISTWTNDSVADLLNNAQLDPGQVADSHAAAEMNNDGRFQPADAQWKGGNAAPGPGHSDMSINTQLQHQQQNQPQQHQLQQNLQQQQQQLQQNQPQQQQLQQNLQQQQLLRPLSQPPRGVLQSDLLFGTPAEDFWTANEGCGFLA